MTKFIRLILALAAMTLMGFAPLAQAEAPQVQTQVTSPFPGLAMSGGMARRATAGCR